MKSVDEPQRHGQRTTLASGLQTDPPTGPEPVHERAVGGRSKIIGVGAQGQRILLRGDDSPAVQGGLEPTIARGRDLGRRRPVVRGHVAHFEFVRTFISE